ncbi:GNAT family N-acetyltransferase [bacterium]|nr:GNAT family N-acetyltransferase [bacterium]
MQIDVVDPLSLSLSDIAQWRSFLADDPALSSPYFTPEWAKAVARRRDDARVVVFRGVRRPIAFLPVLRSNPFAALPIGAPLCDYQAVIAPRGARIDFQAAARALGVGRIDFTAALRTGPTAPCVRTHAAGHVVDFSGGWDAYCEDRRSAGSSVLKRARKKLMKLSRDHDGDVAIDAFSQDGEAFDQLLYWKRQQMQATGVTDIFDHGWIHRLVRDILEHDPASPFGGALFVLRVRQKPAAGLFCLRSGDTLHAWFVGHAPQLAEYSPGQVLFAEAIRVSAEAGFRRMDLGPGDYQFKESFANAVRPVGAGFAGRPSLAAALKGAEFEARRSIEQMPLGAARQWPAKAMRRMDIIRGLAGQKNGAAALIQAL